MSLQEIVIDKESTTLLQSDNRDISYQYLFCGEVHGILIGNTEKSRRHL